MTKTIVTIQDYSCVGRCSLTVALPIISSCGVECIGLPTALLSNHTAYESFTFLNLTSELGKIAKQMSSLNKKVDFIYTGYLTKGQAKTILSLQKSLKNVPLFIDPAFADNGCLYAGLDEEIVRQSKELIAHAEIIKPNLSEAKFLLGEDFDPLAFHDCSFYKNICQQLSLLGPKKIILTGSKTKEGKVGISIYEDGKFSIVEYDELPGKYHGTGDCFASAFIGSYINNGSLVESIKIAHEFVAAAIKKTIQKKKNGVKNGVEFESALHLLYKPTL